MVKRIQFIIIGLILLEVLGFLAIRLSMTKPQNAQSQQVLAVSSEYWLLLHRKSNLEYLYQGRPGAAHESKLIKTFAVKSGIANKRPTPLPQLLGREYWLITDKYDTSESLETAPYFLTLDIPYSEESPYGPAPYEECEGQCNWELPGSFGLHGIAGDLSRILPENEGSSGCIRHTDEDIVYLYNLLNPTEQQIRYYIEDL